MPYISLMRPKDWVKNAFVLIPVLFWFNSPLNDDQLAFHVVLVNTLLTLVGFCLLSSAVYSVNDALDAEKDRSHPVKRSRPVASGAVSPSSAIGFGCILGLMALVLGGIVNQGVLAVFVFYVLLQVFYNLSGKYLILVDVVTIALGFVLRAAAGAFAVDIQLSIWMVLCVFFLCLYLGFVKRLCDLSAARIAGSEDWKPRAGYDDPLELNWLLGVSGVMCLMMYLTYSLSDHAYSIFGARSVGFAMLTPVVLIVVHRFYRRANRGDSESPYAAITRDRTIQFGTFLFVVGILLSLYVPAVERLLSDLLLSTQSSSG